MTAALLAWAWLAAAASGARLRSAGLKLNEGYKLKLDNFNNVQYSASFSLGGQTLPVIYDTGSFEIIVLSTLCSSCARGHTVYNSKNSSSFADSGAIAEHVFGSGRVRSEKGYEEVRLGGAASPCAAPRMPFWQVISHGIQVWDNTAHFSGIVGLGHPERVPLGYGADSQRAQSMLSAMHIDRFTICLERGRAAAPGWLWAGGTGGAQPQARLKVVGQVHWAVRLAGVRAPGLALGGGCAPSCAAIVDSGTSLITAPPQARGMVAALERLVKPDCSNLDQLPVIRFQLENTVVELPPAAYIQRISSKPYKDAAIWRALTGSARLGQMERCSVAFMEIDKESQHGPTWILGMPFLRYYRTVFDRVAKEVHITRSTPTCDVQTGPGPVAFSNATQWQAQDGQLVAGADSTRMFTAADYQPTEVDLGAARLPAWALGPGRRLEV